MASAILQEISKDEKERAILRSQKKYEMDMYSNIETLKRIGEMRSDEKWQVVVTNMKAEIADIKAENARLQAELEKRR